MNKLFNKTGVNTMDLPMGKIDIILDVISGISSASPIEILKVIYNLKKTSETFSERILMEKLVRFIYHVEDLSNRDEEKLNQYFFWNNKRESEAFFFNLFLKLEQINNLNKIKYFAMLSRAAQEESVDSDLFDKFFDTLNKCTVFELEYIKNNIGKTRELDSDKSDITLFTLSQYGLVQNEFIEKTGKYRYIYTSYANYLYIYALNYSKKRTEGTLKINAINDLKLLGDDSKYIKFKNELSVLSTAKEIEIDNIATNIDWNNRLVSINFSFNDNNVSLQWDRFLYTFESTRNYVSKVKKVPYLVGNEIDQINGQYKLEVDLEKDRCRGYIDHSVILFFRCKSTNERYVKIFRYNDKYRFEILPEKIYNSQIAKFDELYATTDKYISLHFEIYNQEFTKI